VTATGPREPWAPEIAASIEPDRPDARDVEYEPADRSAPLPERVGYQRYQDLVGVTWHQRGLECTGFALAAIANYRIRRALDDPATPSVSRRMLYEIAQLHDGEEFVEGSTLRGALKGWHHTGVARRRAVALRPRRRTRPTPRHPHPVTGARRAPPAVVLVSTHRPR
jgi:hypothetical protein